MDALPYELLHNILFRLTKASLSSLSHTSTFFYGIVIAELFADVEFHIDPFTGNLSHQGAKLLVRLYDRQKIGDIVYRPMRYIQRIWVLSSPKSYFPIDVQNSRTLWALLFQFLKHQDIGLSLSGLHLRIGRCGHHKMVPLTIPEHIRTLDIDACYVDKTVMFPQLRELSLRSVQQADVEWIRAQIQHSTLQRLYLASMSSKECIPISRLTHGLGDSFRMLREMRLERMAIDIWPPPGVTRLQSLSIRCCIDTVGMFGRAETCWRELKALTLVTDRDLPEARVHDLKKLLQATKTLTKLALLLEGRKSNIPLQWILPARLNIRTLIIEARPAIVTPVPTCAYSAEEINSLIQDMPQLRILSVAYSDSNRDSALVSIL